MFRRRKEWPNCRATTNSRPPPKEAEAGGASLASDDNVGLFNLLTPERVVEAAGLIRRGALFPLDAPVDAFTPPIAASRGIPRRHLLHVPGTIGFDDVYDNFFPQGSSQWDSLGHVGYAPNMFYNGATEDDVATGRRNTIEHWARRGIAGRAVLLDMVATLADAGRPLRSRHEHGVQRRRPRSRPADGRESSFGRAMSSSSTPASPPGI